MDRRQYVSKGCSNARRPSATTAAASSGKQHKGKSQGGRKRAIKVVYISNPMRVKTSAEGFAALVQELTGRHADPSKYNGGGGGGDGGSSSSTVESMLQAAGGALPSPGSTVETSSSDGAGGAGGHVQAAAFDCDDDYHDDVEGSFAAPQLMIDDRYSVCFSPPTSFLFGSHSYDEVME